MVASLLEELAHMSLSPGDKIGRYTVEAVLGRGAMAQVFVVKHDTLDTRHALKILVGASEGIQERLVQEGKLQAALRHPNVVAVTDVFGKDGAPVLLLDLIEGPDLEQWLARHRPGLSESLAIFGGILAGISAAHRRGIIHRDLKPSNVLLHLQEQEIVPKVLDFGLAKAQGSSLKKTRAGVTMGTPAYMAPEQIRDAASADPRADIFALGCILYELVTGKQCFDAPDIMGIFSKISALEYTPPQDLVPDLPPEIIAAIEGALQTDRERRFADCEALAKVLYGSSERFPTALPCETKGGRVARLIWTKKEAQVRQDSLAAVERRSRSGQRGGAADGRVAPTIDASAPRRWLGWSRGTWALVFLALVGLALSAAVATGVLIFSVRQSFTAAEQRAALQQAAQVEPALTEQPTTEQPTGAEPSSEPEEGREEDAAEPATATGKSAAAAVRANEASPEVVARVQGGTGAQDPASRPKAVVAPAAVEPVRSGVSPQPEAPPMGSFAVTGNASEVRLRAAGVVFTSDQPVPAGSYTILARFGDEDVPAGSVRVAAGQQVRIDCVAAMRRCVVR